MVSGYHASTPPNMVCPDLGSLVGVYEGLGVHTDWYSYGGCPGNPYPVNGYPLPTLTPARLELYKLAYFVLNSSNETGWNPAALATWLSKGNRRLVLVGISPRLVGTQTPAPGTWCGTPATAFSVLVNDWANNFLTALGVPVEIEYKVHFVNPPPFPFECDQAVFDAGYGTAPFFCGNLGSTTPHYLTAGFPYWHGHDSPVVTGGTGLVSSNAGGTGHVNTMSIIKLGGSEVIVLGTYIGLTGARSGCPGSFTGDNSLFLQRLLTMDVQ